MEIFASWVPLFSADRQVTGYRHLQQDVPELLRSACFYLQAPRPVVLRPEDDIEVPVKEDGMLGLQE